MVRPHKYAYNGIIVYYMVKKQIEYSYDTNIGKFTNDPGFNYRLTRDIKYVPVTVTPTELYNEIGHMKKEIQMADDDELEDACKIFGGNGKGTYLSGISYRSYKE